MEIFWAFQLDSSPAPIIPICPFNQNVIFVKIFKFFTLASNLGYEKLIADVKIDNYFIDITF